MKNNEIKFIVALWAHNGECPTKHKKILDENFRWADYGCDCWEWCVRTCPLARLTVPRECHPNEAHERCAKIMFENKEDFVGELL